MFVLASSVLAETVECYFVDETTVIDIDIRPDALNGTLETNEMIMEMRCEKSEFEKDVLVCVTDTIPTYALIYEKIRHLATILKGNFHTGFDAIAEAKCLDR